MTLMMKTCFFSLAILFLWRVQDGAEACTCMNIPPEQVFCRAGIVFRAIVTGSQLVIDPSGNKIRSYYVQVNEVYKGPAIFFTAIYTSSSVGACGVTLQTGGQEYVLTGWLGNDGAVHVSMCDFHVPWFDLTYAQWEELTRCSESDCVCAWEKFTSKLWK